MINDLTFWQWLGAFVRVYVALWGLSGAGWFVWRVMGVSALFDVELVLDFELPAMMFTRKPLPHFSEVRSNVKTQ